MVVGLKQRRCYVVYLLVMLVHQRSTVITTSAEMMLAPAGELQSGESHVIAGAPGYDDAPALQPSDERRSASTNAMRFVGLGRRSSAAGEGTSALKYVGLGKRPNAIKYIGLGKRAPDRSHMHYIGLGKRSGERSALRYMGLGKRKSALSYIGLGKKKSKQQGHDDGGEKNELKRRVAKRGNSRAQPRRRWSSSSTVDPALLAMGIGRK